MATTVYQLVNGKVKGDKLYASEVNGLGNTAEDYYVQLADLFGQAAFGQSEFEITLLPGQLAVQVGPPAGKSARAFVGAAGARKLLKISAGSTVSGFPANATTPLYLQQAGTWGQGAVPAGALHVADVTTNGTEATGYNLFPSGRSDLTHALAALVSSADRRGGYLSDKIKAAADGSITVTKKDAGANEYLELAATLGLTARTIGPHYVTVPRGTDRILKYDLANDGSWTHILAVFVLLDQDPSKTLAHHLPGLLYGTDDRNRHVYVAIENANNAPAGTHGTYEQLEVRLVVVGTGFTAAGGSVPTPTVYEFDYPAASVAADTTDVLAVQVFS